MQRWQPQRPILDVGELNALGDLIGARDYTGEIDLNWRWPIDTAFPTITCFEVLEHVENPLLLLTEIQRHLSDDGRLYLTTPDRWFDWAKGEYHFHEYGEKELRHLLEHAGLKVSHIERMRGYTWQWRFVGIRSMLRWIRDLIRGQCFFVVAEKYTHREFVQDSW